MRALVLFLALALALALASRPAVAGPSESEAKAAARHLLIALRVLSYDKQLAERSPGSSTTIVLISSPTPAGRSLRATYEAGFTLMPKVKVGGRSVRVVSLDVDKKLADNLASYSPCALIVLDDVGTQLATVRTAARARSVLSMSMREADAKAGLSVAIVQAKERDQIVINIEASRAEKVRFGAGLLQLARLVEEP